MMKRAWPWWVKGALCGAGSYVLVILLDVLLFFGIEKVPISFEPGSLSFLIPLLAIAFYPALLFIGNYEKIILIIPLNLLFYTLLGVVVALVVRMARKVELI